MFCPYLFFLISSIFKNKSTASFISESSAPLAFIRLVIPSSAHISNSVFTSKSVA